MGYRENLIKIEHDAIHRKAYSDGSAIRLCFFSKFYPNCVSPIPDYIQGNNREYEKEYNEIIKIFHNKKLNNQTKDLLKGKGFKEEIKSK